MCFKHILIFLLYLCAKPLINMCESHRPIEYNQLTINWIKKKFHDYLEI